MSELTIIKASAGSGKTFSLTRNFIKISLAEHPKYYRHILAVTFTNKATAEMKSRILEELYKLGSGKKSAHLEALLESLNPISESELRNKSQEILNSILHGYSWFKIETIDSFFQGVIRSFLYEIGIPGNYSIELDQDKILNEAIDNFLDQLDEEKNTLSWIVEYIELKIEEGKTFNLKKELNTLGKQIFNETFLSKGDITNELFKNTGFLKDFKDVLFIYKNTFTSQVRKKSQVIYNAIKTAGYTESDFYYGSNGPYGFIKNNAKGLFSIPKTRVRDVIINPDKWASGKARDKNEIITFAKQKIHDNLIELVSLFENDYINYISAVATIKNFYILGLLHNLEQEIKSVTSEKGIMLISNSAPFIHKIIDNNDIPFIYEKTGIQFRHVLIDEFQDTSSLQWENFKPLISNSLSWDKNCLVVGDVKQSIYRWRNSNWEIIAGKVKDGFPENVINEKSLDTNWRSMANIILFNNDFFGRITQVVTSIADTESIDAIPIDNIYCDVTQKISPNIAKTEGYVSIKFYEPDDYKDHKEYYGDEIIERINELLENNYLAGDITILVRNKNEGIEIANFLVEANKKGEFIQQIGVISNESLFLNHSTVVKFVLATLKYISNSNELIIGAELLASWMQLFSTENKDKTNFPSTTFNLLLLEKYIGKEKITELKALSVDSLYNVAESICNIFNLYNFKEEIVYLHSFLDVVFDFSTKENAGIYGFLNYWEEEGNLKTISAAETSEAIKILTIHKSKGLEFPVVIIPFTDWDYNPKTNEILWIEPEVEPYDKAPLIPVSYSKILEETHFRYSYIKEKYMSLVDNINLLYVALTRPVDVLICLAKKSKNPVKHMGDIVFKTMELLVGSNIEIKQSGENRYTCGEIKQKDLVESKETVEQINVSGFKRGFPEVRISRDSMAFIRNKNGIKDPATIGRILHALMEKIHTYSDVQKALQDFILKGIISIDEYETFKRKIQRALNNPQIEGWFSGEFKVLTETNIIGIEGDTKRPDRVMIKDNQAIIVDYKFGGEKDMNKHIRQISTYMELLKTMGFKDVLGFIWYVFENDLMEVKI